MTLSQVTIDNCYYSMLIFSTALMVSTPVRSTTQQGLINPSESETRSRPDAAGFNSSAMDAALKDNDARNDEAENDEDAAGKNREEDDVVYAPAAASTNSPESFGKYMVSVLVDPIGGKSRCCFGIH